MLPAIRNTQTSMKFSILSLKICALGIIKDQRAFSVKKATSCWVWAQTTCTNTCYYHTHPRALRVIIIIKASGCIHPRTDSLYRERRGWQNVAPRSARTSVIAEPSSSQGSLGCWVNKSCYTVGLGKLNGIVELINEVEVRYQAVPGIARHRSNLVGQLLLVCHQNMVSYLFVMF